MEMSDNIADLAAALSKAQGAVKGALKDSVNPGFKSKYADLASVWDACRDALSTNGLALLQLPGPLHESRLSMTTMLTHASGQWMRETLTIPLQKVDAQGYGSALTYSRRYALAAFIGIAQEDDDGNAAAANAPDKARSVAQHSATSTGGTKAAKADWPAWEKAVRDCESIAALSEWWAENRPGKDHKYYAELVKLCAEHKADLAAAIDAMSQPHEHKEAA